MKSKSIVLGVMILSLASFVAAQVRVNGYLSFDYMKGQKDSVDSRGTFRDSLAGLIFSGELTGPQVTYTAEALISAEGEAGLIQAWAGFNPADYLHIRMGLYLIPFGVYNREHRAHQSMLIRPPLVVDYVMPERWRDIGVLLEGNYRSIVYAVYTGNGLAEEDFLFNGLQFTDNNSNKALGGRIGLSLSQRFQVAYSHYRGKYDRTDDRSLSMQGGDLSWISETFALRSEYIRARFENPEGYSKGEIDGYYVSFSFTLWGIRPLVGYQGLEYKDDYHGNGFSPGKAGEGVTLSQSRWVLGAIYFPAENVLIKLEYDLNRTKGSELKDNMISVEVGLTF